MPQQAALYRRLTVEENLLLFARLEGHEDPHASVEEMLELSGLGERRGEAVARLSGGNQQRVNIAIGLLSRPVGAAPRRAQRRPRPAPAGAALGVRRGARRARHDGDLLHPRHPGGRALRPPAARPRRRREPLRRLARGAARGGPQRGARGRRAATSRPPSSPSSTTGGTEPCAGCCSRTCRSCAARRCRPCCSSPTRC